MGDHHGLFPIGYLLHRLVNPQQISWVFLDPGRHCFHRSTVEESLARTSTSHHQVIRPCGWSFQVLEDNRPCYHPDVRASPNSNPALLQSEIRTYAGFPVYAQPSPVATVFVNRVDQDAYSPEVRDQIALLLRECASRLIQLSSGIRVLVGALHSGVAEHSTGSLE